MFVDCISVLVCHCEKVYSNHCLHCFRKQKERGELPDKVFVARRSLLT